MTNTKHTPGPWVARGAIVTTEDDMLYVASTYTPNIKRPSADQMVANARLIAAAPELLVACLAAEERVRELSPQGYVAPEMWTLRAAIAKATGDA